MRNDVHTAALRAAAKVAFSVAFVGGCSAAPATVEGAHAGQPGYGEPTTSESEVNDGPKPYAQADAASADASYADAADASAKPSCQALLDAQFPNEDSYPGTKQLVTPEVQACCVEGLTIDLSLETAEPEPTARSHRWDCCANLPALGPDAGLNVFIACTPWGPPVPPSMTARGRRDLPGTAPDAWRAVA